MGCSNPHPHGQVWSLSYVPTEPATELASFTSYAESGKGSGSLLLDYAILEKEKRERVVVQNEDWLVVTPFWSIWPFEVMGMSMNHPLCLCCPEKLTLKPCSASCKEEDRFVGGLVRRRGHLAR